MRKFYAVILAGLFFVALSGCSAPATNLGDLKLKLFEYNQSGQYLADVAEIDGKALSFITAKAKNVPKPAIVMDIDETSLSNWPQLAANDLTFRLDGPCDHLPKGPCGLTAYQKLAIAPALQASVDLFNAAKAQGVAVFFLTGRDETVRKATERNLRKAGYDGWSELIMRKAGTTTKSASDYKAPERARIESMGYTILATIGDQPSDLAGGHAMKAFLVPNPYYRIP